MGFKIIRNDIVKMNTEAIVNTANSNPTVGTGCDYAVYQAAGHDELLRYRKEKVGTVAEGEVFITPGFGLNQKYIIHAVSPLFIDGKSGEEEKLRSCYRKSLALAKEYGVKSIAFPMISTGGFGYPKEEGIRIAVDEIYDFLFDNEMEIYLLVFDAKSVQLGKKIYPRLEAYIDQNYVSEKHEEEFGLPFYESAKIEETSDDDNHYRRLEQARFLNNRAIEADIDDVMPLSMMSEPVVAKGARPCPPNMSVSKQSIDLAEPDNVEILEAKLEERIKHMSDSYSEYLLYLIERNGFTNAEVYKNALLDKKVFSKIKNGGHPQKITALQLCIGAELSMDDTRDLLARAGYALSPCDLTDVIFSFFIENEIYDMTELDIQLEEHGLPCIIE